MNPQDKAEKLLEGAYALRTADDNRRYYHDFAPIYDTEYVKRMGYSYPAALAKVFHRHASDSDRPVLDIGCGTGLVAEALQLPAEQIDGVDISPQMLALAAGKQLYGQLIDADLSVGVSALGQRYSAMVSAGTFTHGHLGANVLPELLKAALPNALFCLGVNSVHFEQQFDHTLQALVRGQQISTPRFETVKIYSGSDSSHAADTATVMLYRKTG